MKFCHLILVWLGLAGGFTGWATAATYQASPAQPPAPQREFRGVWVATVNNIDWPSKPGLPTSQQKAELLAIFDRATQLRLNAVIFQVRPCCDALYDSKYEPWSEYLTGVMGKKPDPYYDPLEFAVTEAHRRGLELHAWFNPYRVRHPSGKSVVSGNHISRTKPNLVRKYGTYLWLDPGEKAVQDYSIKVVLDVVKRYDVDGVHIDDYFYPYKEKDAAGNFIDFPDWPSWKRYFESGGKLSRDDWRRENVNKFVQRLYESVKAEKSWVKFGVSPFGIWRPGYPEPIRGLDSYAQLYGDSRKWLTNGWLDYVSPQLYWAINPPAQSYPTLLKWWAEQNPKGRHVWPGNNSVKVGTDWKPEEILNQIQLTRNQSGASGNVFWNMGSLMQNKSGWCDQLQRSAYAEPALIPASPWLNSRGPGKANLVVENAATPGALKMSWQPANQEAVRLWVLQMKTNGKWHTDILPGSQLGELLLLRGAFPDMVAISPVDRFGNLGVANVKEKNSVDSPASPR